MKLIKFDTTNVKTIRTGEPTIRFASVGLITISSTFCKEAKLKAGDKVTIAQDEDEPDCWYLIPGDKNGFLLREAKGGGGALSFQSAFIAKTIIKAFELNTKSVSFKMATNPDKLPKELGGGLIYGILTATAKYSELEEEEEENRA